MSKNLSPDDLNRKSKVFSKSPALIRRPIHKDPEKVKEEEEEVFHDENYSEKLYPDIPEIESEEKEDIKESKEQSGSSVLKYLLGILLLVIVYFIGFKPQAFNMSVDKNLDQIVEGMQDHFTNQNPITYRIVKSALRKVVNVSNEPSAPAIITVISNKNAESRASEFLLYLANALVAHNYVLINESTSWQNNPDDIKLKIDGHIRSKMKNNTLSVVIVDKLHNIPYEAAMIFHGYCDHELAPYKHAVFLFHVPLNIILPADASSKKLDIAAMEQLKNIWSQATSDVIDSLITRITVNVVNIR